MLNPNRMSSYKQTGLSLINTVHVILNRAPLVAQMVKNLSAMWEAWVWSLGGEEPPEEGTATHSSILTWRIPWTEEPGGLQPMGLQRVGHNWVGNSLLWYWITKHMQKRETYTWKSSSTSRRNHISPYPSLNHSVDFVHYHQLYVMYYFKVGHLNLYSYVPSASKFRSGQSRAVWLCENGWLWDRFIFQILFFVLNTSLEKEEISVPKQRIYTCWMMDGMLPSLGNLGQRKTVSRKAILHFIG